MVSSSDIFTLQDLEAIDRNSSDLTVLAEREHMKENKQIKIREVNSPALLSLSDILTGGDGCNRETLYAAEYLIGSVRAENTIVPSNCFYVQFPRNVKNF